MFVPNKRYAVFAIREDPRSGHALWARAGWAKINRDSSMNIYLDVLPIEGKLHVREAGERPRVAPIAATATAGVGSETNDSSNNLNGNNLNDGAAIAAQPEGGH